MSNGSERNEMAENTNSCYSMNQIRLPMTVGLGILVCVQNLCVQTTLCFTKTDVMYIIFCGLLKIIEVQTEIAFIKCGFLP